MGRVTCESSLLTHAINLKISAALAVPAPRRRRWKKCCRDSCTRAGADDVAGPTVIIPVIALTTGGVYLRKAVARKP